MPKNDEANNFFIKGSCNLAIPNVGVTRMERSEAILRAAAAVILAGGDM
jgi:hypothetical protein